MRARARARVRARERVRARGRVKMHERGSRLWITPNPSERRARLGAGDRWIEAGESAERRLRTGRACRCSRLAACASRRHRLPARWERRRVRNGTLGIPRGSRSRRVPLRCSLHTNQERLRRTRCSPPGGRPRNSGLFRARGGCAPPQKSAQLPDDFHKRNAGVLEGGGGRVSRSRTSVARLQIFVWGGPAHK